MESTYNISEEFISKMKRNYLYMMISIPLGIIATGVYLLMQDTNSNPNIPLFVGIFGFVIAIIEGEIFIISRVMLKKIKQNQIIIGENFIQRKAKKLEDPIYFQDIKKIHIKKEKSGKISYIDLATQHKKIRLYGIESLEEIANVLEENKGDSSIKEDSLKMNYDNPVVYGVTFVVALVIVIFFEELKGLPVSDLISGVIAIWILFFKPISKAQGKRFRIFEIIVGLVIVICLALSYIVHYI